MPQQFIPSTFEIQYQRVLEAAECRTQAELADFLRIGQPSVSDAKRRAHIPAQWRIKLFEKKRINPDWLLFGRGAKYLVPDYAGQSNPHVVRITEIRPPRECTAQELVNELVRRALEPVDTETVQKEVAATWRQMKKKGNGL